MTLTPHLGGVAPLSFASSQEVVVGVQLVNTVELIYMYSISTEYGQ